MIENQWNYNDFLINLFRKMYVFVYILKISWDWRSVESEIRLTSIDWKSADIEKQ